MSKDALSDEDMDIIWGAHRIDEPTRLELYKLLNELSSRMKLGEVNYIID